MHRVQTLVSLVIFIATIIATSYQPTRAQERDTTTHLDAAWSPDGTRIAMTANRAGNDDIWVITLADGSLHNLTADSLAEDGRPLWSPDGSHIAFLSRRADGITDIWVMEADGSNPRNLTADVGYDASYLQWSLDGGSLLYTVTMASPMVAQVRQVSLEGSVSETLFEWAQVFIFGMVLSPLDGRIATHNIRNQTQVDDWICTGQPTDSRLACANMDAAGLDYFFLPDGLAWSPTDPLLMVSGSHIRPDVLDSVLLTFDTRTEEWQVFYEQESALFSAPHWSPDGQSVLLSIKGEPLDIINENYDLWQLSIEGGEPRNLTKGHYAAAAYPAWSPDGQYVAFSAYSWIETTEGIGTVGASDLWLLDMATGALTNLSGGES